MNRTRQLRKVNSLVTVKLLSKPFILAFTKGKIKKGKVYFIIVKMSKLPRIPGQSCTDSLDKTARTNCRALWSATLSVANGAQGLLWPHSRLPTVGTVKLRRSYLEHL